MRFLMGFLQIGGRGTPCGGWVTRPLCGRGNALRWGLGNPITPIETSRDTLHPGTRGTTRTNRPAGRVRGLGYEVSGFKRLPRNQERFAP